MAARDLGHDYMVLTDHSPRLTVANGLTAERLRAQLVEVALLNEELAPFRILTGIEVDILEDGALDQDDELLAQLDLVVASVHSKLRMPRRPMTERMLAAIRNPHTNVLGHCTGRMVTGHAGSGRSPSSTPDVRLRRPAGGTASRWRSTPGRSGSTRRSGCSGRRSRPAACSRSTPTRTRRASSTGCRTGASGRSPAACRPAGWSTPRTRTSCWPGPAR